MNPISEVVRRRHKVILTKFSQGGLLQSGFHPIAFAFLEVGDGGRRGSRCSLLALQIGGARCRRVAGSVLSLGCCSETGKENGRSELGRKGQWWLA